MTTHNHNHGAGIFNNVGRDQHIQNTILVIRPPAISAREAGKRTIREPYRDAIDSIHVILATLNTFPQTSTVMSLLQEFRSLETMVSFVGKVMGIISSSRLRDHSFFNGVEHHVFKYCQDLRRLKADISMYSDHIKAYMESRWWKRFLLLFSGYSWRPLYEQVKREVGKAQLSLVRFLHLFARHCRNLQHASKEYAELTRIIEDMRPILNTPARHVEVSTIWIREPTGDPWYAIPLNFCASWKDFTLVVTHYCEHGPGSSDVLRGNWEVVDVNKLRVIDKSESINEAMQPEMRFDIGIVIEFPSVMSRTCPFCGNNDIGPKLENGWVRCSNPACSQLFRMVTPTTNKSTRVTSTQTNVKGRAIPSPTVRNAESPVRGSGKASPTSTSARQHRVSNDTPIPQSSPHAQSPGEADIDDEDPPSSDDRSPPGVKFHRILAVISSTPAVLKVQVFDSSSSTNRVDASTPAMLKDPASDSSSSAASELPKASDLSSLTTLADSTPKTEIPKDEALDLLSITYPNGDATHPHQLNAQ
ncbi:hypothetical protein EYR40_001759 [Pleurotus pulmonarius]|nr:hypothetical protein EYR40_001759 [Pleurotus pulmonarius]